MNENEAAETAIIESLRDAIENAKPGVWYQFTVSVCIDKDGNMKYARPHICEFD